MDYGEIITRAWNITWKNKFLWVLGFLAALTSASSNNNSFRYSMNESDFMNDPQTAAQMGALAMGLMCVFMIIGFILWLLSVAARGGLIQGVNRVDDGEKVTLGEAFSAGTSAIWRLIGVYLLAYLPMIIFGVVVAGVMVMAIGSTVAVGAMAQDPSEIMNIVAGSMGMLWMCMCVLICVMIPVGIVLTFIAEFAARGTVIQELGIIESLSHGWNIFKNNLGAVILLWLLMLVIGIIVSIALGMVMVPLAFVIFAPMMTSFMNDGAMSGLNMAWSIMGGLCLGIFGALLMSVIQTWMSAIWTLAYKEFTGKDPKHLPVEKVA